MIRSSIFLFMLVLLAPSLHAEPCPDSNPCVCTAELLIKTLTQIRGSLLPPTAWAPITSIIPTIRDLLRRPAPTPTQEASFTRVIEGAVDAMFASQFAAHAVTNNARNSWRRVNQLLSEIKNGECAKDPALDTPPTADVFMQRFPPTVSIVGKLLSYDALRTVIKPMDRALNSTAARFSDYSVNEEVGDAVTRAVGLLNGVVDADFGKNVTDVNVKKIEEIDLDGVFRRLLYVWYRARKRSERRVLLAVADQVEPLSRPSLCAMAPVNNITCAMCT